VSEPDSEKLHGIVTNQKSNPDILLNARCSLEDRIATKATICDALSLKGAVWLALLNDYWLADDDTYKRAFKAIAITHPFEKILLVSGSGAVAQLYPE
jgi:hypothetical protein